MREVRQSDSTRGPGPWFRRRAWRCGLVVGVGIATIVTVAGCRQVGTRRGGIRNMQLTDFGGYLEFVARRRDREQISKLGAGKTRFEETIMEENLKLEMDGYVYHPNFLEFTLGGLFGLLQHDYEDVFGGRRRTSSNDGDVVEFDLRGNFLKKKMYPGSVFARRYRAFEPRAFQPSLETTTTNYGVTWQYTDQTMPTNFQFTSTDVRLDPNSDLEEEGRQENMQVRFETAYKFSEMNFFSLIYSHESVDEQPFELSYTTDELTLSHRWDFGPNSLHRLDSEINLYDQRGTFNIERLRWREMLRLEHSKTLHTWYLMEVLDRTQGSLSGVAPIDERSLSVSATLEHKLYESLVTQLNGFAQTQEFGSGLTIDRWGGTANLDYRKKNPWGALLAHYELRLELEDRSGGLQRGEVLDEKHTFQDPEPVRLSATRIDTGTILITAEDRVTIYRLGRDFTVHTVGDHVELRRMPTGRILDGQTFLVDYVFDIGGDYRLDTLHQFLRVRQDFDFGLSPYYRLQRQDQTVTPKVTAGVTPEDITAHTLGVEYTFKGLRLSAEIEDHESNINPFDAVRLNARLRHRFAGGATGALQGRWSRISHQPPNERETRFVSLEGRYRHPITRSLSVEGVVMYRNENDSLIGRDEGVDVDLVLEWIIRDTEVRVTYEAGRFDDDYSENEYSSLYVQIRRRF